MVVKILRSGYCNLMLAYWVEYICDINGKTRTYFDYAYERNLFIKENQ